MQRIKLCEDILINVNKITIRKCDRDKYIKFAKRLDKELREKYGKYYICDQVNESRDYPNIFYVEAFYRNIDGVYSESEKISKFIEQEYENEFGDDIERITLTTFREVNKVYPISKNNCECEEEKE